MKAIQVAKFGGPKVLKLQEVNVPVINNSQVLVKILSVGVNPVDTYIREGLFHKKAELPYIPGKDAAGIVEKVGTNVTKFHKGERVFLNVKKGGTYAEYCAADEEDTFPLNERLDFHQGAALGIPYFTAYRALFIKGKAVSGETVLVHGASGAVGLAAVQMAHKHKMMVFGTAGTTEGLELVKTNGANYVFCHRDRDYQQQIMEQTGNRGVDLIIEMLANVNLGKDLDLLAPGGRVMIVGSRGAVQIDPRSMMVPETSITGVALYSESKKEREETVQAVLAGIQDGHLTPVIGKCYSLDQVQNAHKDIIGSNGAKGKLVLQIAIS